MNNHDHDDHSITSKTNVTLSLRDWVGVIFVLIGATAWLIVQNMSIQENQEHIKEIQVAIKSMAEDSRVYAESLAVISEKLSKATPADVLMEVRNLEILKERDVKRILAECLEPTNKRIRDLEIQIHKRE